MISASMGVWGEQVSEFAAGHRVVAVDLRGQGQSPPPVGEFNPVADLECVATRLGLAHPVVMGVGDGAKYALQLAAAARITVAGLVLAAPEISWALERVAPDVWPDDAAEVLEPILSEMDSSGVSAALERRDFTELARFNADEGGGLTPGHPSRELLYDMALTNMGYLFDHSTLAALGEQYDADALQRLLTPTLVITNTRPRMARWGRLLARYLPNCTVRSMPTTAALVNLEAPRCFSEIVMPFLDALPCRQRTC
jgi:pimeloyl-ACP methyl ester carboxylesterase